MSTKLNPYINFNGTTRGAMEFYQSVVGGELAVSTFKDFGGTGNPADDELVMHSAIDNGKGVSFMASDVPSHMEYKPGTNMYMSLSGEDEAELRGYWDGLTVGATVSQPLEKAPWGDIFGMFVDKFGIQWLVNVVAPKV
jgi:PhnB protein